MWLGWFRHIRQFCNNPLYLCLWPKAPWMRVVGLPSLPPRYALTRFKQVEEGTRCICSIQRSFHTSTSWCLLMLMLTDWQPGRLELLLWKTSIQSTGKAYFLTKRVVFKISTTLINTQQIGYERRRKQELKYSCIIKTQHSIGWSQLWLLLDRSLGSGSLATVTQQGKTLIIFYKQPLLQKKVVGKY